MNSYYVYEAPVRLWHWINALCLLVLSTSGFLIARPLWPVPEGEASAHFVMGYVRFAHFASGYVFAIALIGRVYWAFAGNRFARQLFGVPIFNRRWWSGVWHQWRWYLFRVPAPRIHLDHDPLAQLVMFAMFTVPAFFMVVTGFALYGEGAGAGSWAARVFGWVIPWFGQSQDVHTWHHLGMWVLVVFTLTHVYAAVREEIMSGRTILSVMISGYRHIGAYKPKPRRK